MKAHIFSIGLTAAALLLHVSLSVAVENTEVKPQESSGKAKVISESGKVDKLAKRKVQANIKLVNINGATHEELKKLPGIGNTEADKIVAGRPYASKADLVTHNIISRSAYEPLKKLIIAKQPYKDGAKNAAIYNKKK